MSKIVLSVVGVVSSITLLVISVLLAEANIINTVTATILITISAVLVLIGIFYAAKIDYKTSVYQCRKCNHIFKPSYDAYLFGAHTLTTRYLYCPECGEKSWCIRKSDK